VKSLYQAKEYDKVIEVLETAKDDTFTSPKELDFIISQLSKTKRPMPCPKCGEDQPAEFERGLNAWYLSWCFNCAFIEQKAKIAKNINRWLFDKGIPRRFLEATTEHIQPVYLKAWGDVKATTKGLYIYGPRGVGKTHLVAALAREIAFEPPTDGSGTDNYHFAVFTSVPELLQQIKATFHPDADDTSANILSLYSRAKILILDDLGAEKPSEWVAETLYLLINRRYEDMKQTIITSNLTLSELSQRLDDRIASRIAEMCKVVAMKGKDRRVER
jgi:DNA replication protein DnaC